VVKPRCPAPLLLAVVIRLISCTGEWTAGDLIKLRIVVTAELAKPALIALALCRNLLPQVTHQRLEVRKRRHRVVELVGCATLELTACLLACRVAAIFVLGAAIHRDRHPMIPIRAAVWHSICLILISFVSSCEGWLEIV
jgi:hypothetical protein